MFSLKAPSAATGLGKRSTSCRNKSRSCAIRCPVPARLKVTAQASATSASGYSPALSTIDVEERRSLVLDTMNWFRVPIKVYFKGGCMETALQELVGKKRCFIVTDKFMFDQEYVDKVSHILEKINVQRQVFYHVEREPTEATIRMGLAEIEEYRPDVIIALGGGAQMDAAKIMWLLYESPNLSLNQLIEDANLGRSRVGDKTTAGTRALCICIATTSGTGSEVTPFAVIRDAEGRKVTLATYALTPSMAILDPQLVINLPPSQTRYGGQLTLAHAFESYISIFSSDYSRGLSKHAMTMMTRYYERAYKKGNTDFHAREKMHNAATVAGMAFANTYLGVCHALASEVSSVTGCHLGLVSGILLPHILRYMAQDKAVRASVSDLADHLHVGGSTQDQRYNNVMKWLEHMNMSVDMPKTLPAALGEDAYKLMLAKEDRICLGALDNAHVMASPVQPTMKDLKDILAAASVA